MLWYCSQYTVTIAYLVNISITVGYTTVKDQLLHYFRDRKPDRMIDMTRHSVHVFNSDKQSSNR